MSRFTGNRSGPTVAPAVTVLCVAQFVVVLDVTIVATALPDVGHSLKLSPGGLGWVITAYTVVLAGLLIVGGRLADLAGPARMFRLGLAVFTAASLVCALAWSAPILIGARVVQGIGAAMLSPAALATITLAVEGTSAARRALGWWTAAAAGGGASGWVVGGVLVQTLGWRWVFGINVPIGIAALVLGRAALTGVTNARQPDGERMTGAAWSHRLDPAGALALTGALVAITLGLTSLAERPAGAVGWGELIAAAVLLAVFVRHERRAAEPLLPASLMRTCGVVGGNLVALALTASTTPAMLTAVLYVREVLGLAPAAASLLFPMFNVAVMGASLTGPALLARLGSRAVPLAGLAGVGVGAAVLLTVPARGLPVATLLIAFALMGAGLGIASVASTAVATAAADPADRGVASGLVNSTAQLGSAVGLAVTTPIAAAATSMTGYRIGFGVAAVVALAGLVGCLTRRVLPAAAAAR